MENKKAIRRQILARRRELSQEEVENLSRKVCRNIEKLDIYKEAADLCLYMPINNEVDITLLNVSGKRLWLPVTRGPEMDFFHYEPGMPMKEGAYGIKVPCSDEMLEPDGKTLIIMPGAVFSEKGDRIGYGGGYYDRYLACHPLCRTCAAAYDFQVINEIPTEEHDIRPQFIVTSETIICP